MMLLKERRVSPGIQRNFANGSKQSRRVINHEWKKSGGINPHPKKSMHPVLKSYYPKEKGTKERKKEVSPI